MSDRQNLINTIEKDGKFSTFARMLKSSKAVDLIAGAGPFTVFAPTNDAFGKVSDAQMNSWQNQTDQTDLANVLSYHMIASKLISSKLAGEKPTATLSGADVTFNNNDGLKVNDSGVQARNIEASNGIIHALDTVLTPPAAAIAASAATAGAATGTAPAPVTPPTPQADGHSDVAAANTGAPALLPTNPTPHLL